jgi:hypothetical protein
MVTDTITLLKSLDSFFVLQLRITIYVLSNAPKKMASSESKAPE